MKRNNLLITVMCNLFLISLLAQQEENFYTTKAILDPYYDSLIQVNGIDSMQGTGYKQYMKWINYWEPRLYPHGSFDSCKQGLEQYIAEYVNGMGTEQTAIFTLDWRLIGPSKMPEGSSSAFKGLGQIHYIAFDPNDTSTQKIFACSPAGGLWRTIDGGDSWFNAGTDNGLPLCGVSSIAIDPQNSDTNWFITTGNAEGLNSNVWQYAIGIWRTTDAGNTWQQIGLETSNNMRKVILTWYQGKAHLFVTTTNGIWECEDALASEPDFDRLIEGDFYDVEFDPSNTGIVYASGTGMNTSLYKIDWINDIYTELPNISTIPVEEGRRLIIEISEASPNNLFIVSTYKGGSQKSYIYKYNLLTNVLVNKGELPKPVHDAQGVGPERAMGWTISPVLNSNDELIMIHGNTAPIRQSNNLLDDNICIWTDVTSTYNACEIHVDMHYMVFEPDGQTLWVGSDGGVYKSTMPDLANNWEEKCNGLAVATVEHAAISGLNKDIALSGNFDCGINLFTRTNEIWNEKHKIGGDGFQCRFDWSTSQRMWAGTNGWSSGRVYRSENSGQSFNYQSSGFHWHTFFIQNFISSEVLYGTNANGVMRSINKGTSWQNYANYPDVNNNNTWRVATSITHGNYLYSSWYGNTTGNPQKIFKSVTGGGTNTSDWEDVGSPLINSWINSIAIDYFDPDHIWVAAGGKVYDVNTITHQWTDISNGLPSYPWWFNVKHLEIVPGASETLYAGTNMGLYYYTAQDGVWQKVEDNLPNVEIKDIQIDMTNNRIIVATYGRGVWEAGLPCITSDETTFITSDVTWDLDRYIVGTLSIEANRTLTIENSTIRLNEDSKIIIKPGAKLIIDGARLTNACSEAWLGIEVWGNSNAHQYPDGNGNYQQGYVELKNGAIIENAWEAIQPWRPNGWTESGGIIVANGATFRNNRRAVQFMSYQNFDPVTGEPRPNQSYFSNCTFETNDDFEGLFGESPFHTFVSMWKVDGVEFLGCDFIDSRPVFQHQDPSEGVGILTIDANFYVLPRCIDNITTCWECTQNNLDYSSFSGLNIGINSAQENTLNTFVVDRTDFIQNLNGIVNQANHLATCIRSDFEVGTKQTTGNYEWPIGILNSRSTDFTFDQNEFSLHENVPSDLDGTIGIWNTHLGEEGNIIFKNTYTGFDFANLASGDNHNNYYPELGLQYRCNENSANKQYDFYVGWQNDEGIATYQGSSSNPAGNTFSHLTSPNYPVGSDFSNIAIWPVNYYYYTGDPDQEPLNTIGVWKTGTDNENDCIDRISSGSDIRLSEAEKTAYRQQYYDNKLEYNGTKVLFESLKDGGSTPGTILDIETSWPEDTWELRAQLLAGSPHLSLEVLMEAASRTDVLPHTIMFEICIANPEEMRNERLLEYLATKDDPMPQYMIDDLRDGADEDTYKSVLLNEMAGYAYDWGEACTYLLRDIVLDSTGIKNDSLRFWLTKKESLLSEYQIVNSYLAEDDLTNALTYLNDIPNNYDLSDKQLSEYNYFHDLKSTFITAQQQGRNIMQLDSLEVLDLVYIADSSLGLAGAQARSLLNFAYGYAYFEKPEIAVNGMKEAKVQNKVFQNDNLNNETHFVTAYPNPASQWVAFDYTLPYPAENATIFITDLSGRAINTITVNRAYGQTVWDSQGVPSGIYFYSLEVNGTIIDKRKLIITK